MKTHIDFTSKIILVTGCPGFIGSNLVMRLLTDKGLMTANVKQNFTLQNIFVGCCTYIL